MSVLMMFRIALKALGRNKMRTALTMLGMIIGVGAVITMVALGTGAQSSIEAQIQSAGTNMIIRSAPGTSTQGGVRQGQGNASTLVPGRRRRDFASCPACSTRRPASNTRGQMIAGNQNWNTQVQGTDVDCPLIRPWQIEQGAFFTPQDVATASKVASSARVVRDQLFGTGRRSGRPGDPHPATSRSPSSACWHQGPDRASARIRTTSCSCRTRR